MLARKLLAVTEWSTGSSRPSPSSLAGEGEDDGESEKREQMWMTGCHDTVQTTQGGDTRGGAKHTKAGTCGSQQEHV